MYSISATCEASYEGLLVINAAEVANAPQTFQCGTNGRYIFIYDGGQMDIDTIECL
jgi:hypothetical protein